MLQTIIYLVFVMKRENNTLGKDKTSQKELV